MSSISLNKPVLVAQATRVPAKPVCKELEKLFGGLKNSQDILEDNLISGITSPEQAAKIMLQKLDKLKAINYLNLRIKDNMHQIDYAFYPKKSMCCPKSADAPPSAKEIIDASNNYIKAEKAILKALDKMDKKPQMAPSPSPNPQHYPRRISPMV